MKPNEKPKAIYAKDYEPSAYLIETVDLSFDLDPLNTLVVSKLSIKRNPASVAEKVLILVGEQLVLKKVCLDGRLLESSDYQIDDKQLCIPVEVDKFELEITTQIQPEKNTALEGLYVSSGNFCTQCEAEGFRKITYYLDRPDVMSKFTTTIRADKDKYPVLLSNGNLIEQGEGPEGKHWVVWEDPFLKPSYLFALVAGDLVCIQDTYVTGSGHEKDLRIYVQAHNRDKCGHAMESLKHSMRWDEQRFGLEYDLNTYMIVAVDDFNMGAMENKGLNVFNSKFVLAKPETATDHDFQGIEGVIGHEYFHNWTGNRVTCRDWFQLSLKEGLTVFRDQEFSSDMGSRAVKRIEDVRLLRTVQFSEDAGPMAHPVRPDSYIEINNFYTVTVYEKGAELIRMQHTLLGEEGFRKGMDLYFQRHDGQAVAIEDFVAAMEAANKADLAQFRLWYSQAGTPVLDVTDEFDAAKQEYKLTIKQSCPATPNQPNKQAMHIPVAVGLLNESGEDLPLSIQGVQIVDQHTAILNLTEEEQTFIFPQVEVKPIPSLLRKFSAPVYLNYDYADTDLRLLMASDSDSFNRWESGQRLAMRIIQSLVKDYQSGQALQLSKEYLKSIEQLLWDSSQEQALIAEALILPSERYIAEQMDVIDVEAIHMAREYVMTAIAETHRDRFRNYYDELLDEGEYKVDAAAIGQRKLKNTCLHYLGHLANAEAVDLCLRQYRQANNMTDAIAALNLLVNIQGQVRDEVLNDFYTRWQDDALVVDKWLTIQATSKLPDALARVKQLMQHSAFSLKNPNKLRALLGAFCMNNSVRFHDITGEGYNLLADTVLELDSLNPQVAARMVSAFNQWKRHDKTRSNLMKQQLERIVGQSDLSGDVYEIVSKSLN